MCGKPQIVGVVSALRVGNKVHGGVVGGTSFHRKVQLPDSVYSWRGLYDVEGGWAAAFFCAVIDDSDFWRDGVNECDAAALVEAVVRGDVDVDFSEAVDRAHEFAFFVGGEVAEVEDAEFAEGDEDAEGARVFGGVGGWFGGIGAIGIGLAGAGKWRLDDGAVGGDDFGSDALDGKDVAWFGDYVIVFSGVE